MPRMQDTETKTVKEPFHVWKEGRRRKRPVKSRTPSAPYTSCQSYEACLARLATGIACELVDEDVASLHAVKALYEKTKHTFKKIHLKHVHIFLHPVSFDKLHRLDSGPFYAS